jgi:hypothetical protein
MLGGVDHVNIWALIDGLKQDEVLARQMTLAELAGAPYPETSHEVRKKHERITMLLDRYRNGRLGLLRLVQGLASNLNYH